MTSNATIPRRLTRIDDLSRPDHSYLTEADACYFVGEYTARQGYACSATNGLISNFQKPVDRQGRPDWPYKRKAIQEAAAAFRKALQPGALKRPIFAPVPPSRRHGDALYGGRLTRMLNAIPRGRQQSLDVRELHYQTESTAAVHVNDVRPGPDDIASLYRIDEDLTAPTVIAIVDDILATGAHFRAAATLLSAQFPEAGIIGLFNARRVPETIGPEAFDDLEA